MKKFLIVLLALSFMSFTLKDSWGKKPRFGLVFFYKPEQSFVDSLKAKLKRVYGINKIEIIKEDYKPDSIYFHEEFYDADTMVDKLLDFLDSRHNRILAFTHDGLYYIEGYVAEPLHGYTQKLSSVITDKMIGNLTHNNEYYINIALHEVGHLYGLAHCDNENCLMISVGHLQNDTLCARCKRLLETFQKYE
jgi:predicted Zn-dependent protease